MKIINTIFRGSSLFTLSVYLFLGLSLSLSFACLSSLPAVELENMDDVLIKDSISIKKESYKKKVQLFNLLDLNDTKFYLPRFGVGQYCLISISWLIKTTGATFSLRAPPYHVPT
ncbi:MAG: hypothetical protein HKM93_04975 [Desulfobacteraceae bacterium]|nr:hypothetical protein [Desulfobacteraceae bacterium]